MRPIRAVEAVGGYRRVHSYARHEGLIVRGMAAEHEIDDIEKRLRTEFQDEQTRTLDSFLRTLDQKVLPRIARVEEAVGAQGAEIGLIRQRIDTTDVTLDRVLERIEKAVNSMSTQPSSYPGYANPHVMAIHQKAVA